MTRQLIARHLIALLAAAGWTACGKPKTEPAAQEHAAASPPAAPAVDEHAGHGTAAPADGGSAGRGPAASADGGSALPGYASVAVDPTRQQLLGIKTAPVERQTIDRSIRTVGIVQTDETRTSHVHVKFEGFIEQIYVNYTGRLVRKGQPLFKIFSRELLAAEQEYVSSRTALARVPTAAGEAVRGSAQQLAAASRERLRLFDVPPALLTEIERTGVAQRAITIMSPQTGTVVEKQAIAGLAVTPMMHLYVIADLSKVWVLADIYERDLAQIKVGQQAKMRIEALPGRSLEGTVTFASPTVDQATRTVKVRFEFPNREGALRPGMYATVEIAAPGGQALVIPSDSVVDTGERKIVFVTKGEGRFEPQPIVTGAAFNGRYEVIEGLREGDIIATSGQFLLDSESRLRGARTPGGPKHGGH
jgi:membrane fusion protein, copper/silver efflux system